MSNVKVAVRVRPINKRELDQNGKSIVDTNGDAISVTNIKVDSNAEYGDSRERIKTFTFDYCYDSTGEPHSPQYAPQQLVFQDLGTEVLQAAFEGYNACVLAYGQTSTGKTYTMTGIREDPGLIPRICEGLFSHVDDFEASDRTTFRVNISYLEIYNERVRDLLRPSLSQRNEKYTLKVREHPKEGPYVQDLSSHFVKDNEQIQTLLDKGNESRTTASTYMHDHSSRSHAIVTINFIQAKLDDDLPHEIVSKIHLVDLAGSERADPNWSLNYKGRLKEGSNINKSLVTLGNVIKTLAEKSILSWSTDSLGSTQSFASSGGGEGRASPFCSPKRMRLPYIPYRDSVLTWLLKDSLGGNSKTIMIATISPASICYNETISTLRYAQRAKNIVNKPKINEDASVTLIRELRSEIDRLKNMLSTSQMGESMLPIQDSGQALEQQLQLQEDRANKLTQTWMDKWMEAHEIIKESDLSIRGLNKASSMGVLIDSQMPHLIGMDSDILSTGVIIYHLKEGKTLVGKEDAKREQDIVLNGPGIQREHCLIKNVDGSVTLYPNRGSHCTVNGLDCKAPVLLKQGDSVILGKSQMFRFNNPAEAAVLRERRASQECLLDEPTSPSFMETDQHRTVTASRTHWDGVPYHEFSWSKNTTGAPI
ncbi:StAR-related lipid transfer protein 9 [Mytilus galloprovincialis]|uniref:Kinesin-like protein n=1 Tax=Mytilus galloprovincialis TaxID=29158 RepID=A0A8B6HEU4_MYTGA|nr:StAR-related lipid transfer protein 9 [Mytilus galloprovincialis]